MLKRYLAALLALLLCAVPALAEGADYEGSGYRLTLPEGLELLPAETVRGYFEAALADAKEAVDAEEAPELDLDAIMMASSADGTKSVNITYEASDGRKALEYAQSVAADFRDVLEGASVGEAEEVAYGDTAFARVSYTLYGNEVQQYLTVSGERLYIITCANLEQAEIEAMLTSFTAE